MARKVLLHQTGPAAVLTVELIPTPEPAKHVTKALRSWLSRLQTIVDQVQARGETQPRVDPKAVATLIAASPEGVLMMSRSVVMKHFSVFRRI
jgi:hypothetical protein